MSENENKKGLFDEEDFVQKLSPEEKKEERLKHLLSTVEQGWKISIIRVQPSWCRGHLETIEIYDPSEPVDIDYLIRTWGGQRLHLKVHNERGDWVGAGSISLFSYPPRVQGKVITASDVMAEMPITQSPQPNPFQAFPQPAGQHIDIAQLFKLMRDGKRSEVDLALQILKAAPQTAQPQYQPQQQAQMGNMFEQMGAMMQMFSQMREFLGDMSSGGQAHGHDHDDMGPMIGEMVKGLLGSMQQKTDQPKALKPSIRAPRSIPSPISTVPRPDENRVKVVPPYEVATDDKLSTFASKLAGLSAQDAAEVIIQAMGDMPESKRSEAIQNFMEMMTQDDSDLDELLNTDDNYSHDEDIDPVTPSSNQSQGQGR